MLHRQFYVTELTMSDEVVPLVGGDLLAVRYPEREDIDWELVAQSPSRHHIERGVYNLVMHGPEGRWSGPALLVRSDGTSHVFRGAGPLDGAEL